MGMDHVEDDTLFEEAGTGSERDNMDMVKTTFFNICCIFFINSSHSLPALGTQSAAAKTPVSLLQELYVKKGINPKYDLIQIEGAIHEPTFKYRVSVGDLVGKKDLVC